MKTYSGTPCLALPWVWNDARRPHFILWWPKSGCGYHVFKVFCENYVTQKNDRDNTRIIWNLSSCQTWQSKKQFRYNRAPGATLELFLCRKLKMRHYSVAQATARCRIKFFEDFDKVDYEGKRKEKAVSGKKKVWNFCLKSEMNKHFCGKSFLEGGFPGT